MYLEISGRQTHKTARMIQEIERWLSNPNNFAILTVHSRQYADHLMRDIHPRYHDRLFIGPILHTNVQKLRGIMMPDNPRVRYFWDEFDFCNALDVPIDKNGYYTTTVKNKRTIEDWENWTNDPLLRLIVANDFMYTAHHGMKSFFDGDHRRLELVMDSMNQEQFDMEFMCGFDTCARREKPRDKYLTKLAQDFRQCRLG